MIREENTNHQELAKLRTEIQTLRNTTQNRVSDSTGGPPQSNEGSDGDTIFRLTSDKGLLMFHKFSGVWYSSPFNIGPWTLEDSINELVQDITVSNITIEESTLASQNISGTLTILNAGTFAVNPSATVTGLSHSDLDDVGTGTGLGGNAHTQYTGAWSITNSQTLEFSTAQQAGNISVGAVEAVLKNASLVADGSGLAVNESGYSFTLDNILTLQPSGSTSLHISSAFADKIKLTDNSKDVVIGSSNAGDLNLTPVNGAKVLIQGDNSSNNAGLGSSTYASGWGGAGWSVSRPASGFSASEWMLEVDNLSVRGTMSVFELLINQIRATNGTLFVSSVAKVFAIVDGDTIAFEDPSGNGLTPFAVGDILLCQRVEVGTAADAYSDTNTNFVKRVVIQVTAVGSTTIDDNTYGTIDYSTTTGGPTYVGSIAVGDDYVRIGSTSNAARRASILLTADFANAPFIDFLDGVDSWTAWKGTAKNKARLGNLTGITDSEIGSLSGFGLYADNVFLKGQMYAESGYIGTKDAGWTINTDGISTAVAGRKIFMGTGGDNDTYGHQDCWFLAESYNPGDGDIEARMSLGDCFKVDSDTHEIKLSESANNYVHIKAAEPQILVQSNGARALTFASTGPTFILGNPDASNPNYLQYSGTDFTLVSHGDQYFKVASGVTPTVTIGKPTGNSTTWTEITGGSFSIKNRDSGATVTTPISLNSEGDVVITGSLSIPQDAGSIATAQAAAVAAQAAAVAAQGELDDISADGKVTPEEKTSAKLLFTTIGGENSGLRTQATAQGVVLTNFDADYNALVTYIEDTIEVFDDMAVTTNITRSTWDTKWGNYYEEKQTLLNALAADAETKADVAQAAAVVADGIADQAILDAAAADAKAVVADGIADQAILDAAAANGNISDMSADTIITPSEKLTAKLLYDTIVGEYAGILAQGTAQGVTTTTYTNNYNALVAYIGVGETNVFGSMGANTTIVRATWDAEWKLYYTTKQALLNTIAADAETKADTADGIADQAVLDAAAASAAAAVADAKAVVVAADLVTANAHLAFLPVGHASPSSTGYFSNSTHLGFHHVTNGWTTYMGASGSFYLSGTGTNGLTWNGSTLAINGSLNVASTANNTSITANEINMYDGSGSATIRIHATTDALGRVSGAAGLQPQLGIQLGQGGNDGGYLDCYADDDHVSTIVPGTVYSSRGFSTRSASSGRLGWQIYGASESGALTDDWIGFGSLNLPTGAVLWGATSAKEHDNGWMYTNNYDSFGIRFKHDPYDVTEAGGAVAMTMERRFTSSSWNTTRNDNPMSWRVIVWFYFPGNSTYDDAFD